MSNIVQSVESLAPAVASIAAAIDPKDAKTIIAAEATLQQLAPLAQEIEALQQAKAAVDPAVWDEIVASNKAADDALAADAPAA